MGPVVESGPVTRAARTTRGLGGPALTATVLIATAGGLLTTGAVPASASANAVRPAPPPVAAPQSVAVRLQDGATTLSWAFPDPDAWRYPVHRPTDPNAAWTPLTDDSTTAGIFDDTSAPKGIAYYYVASVDSAGADSAPSPTVTVDRITPAPPTRP